MKFDGKRGEEVQVKEEFKEQTPDGKLLSMVRLSVKVKNDTMNPTCPEVYIRDEAGNVLAHHRHGALLQPGDSFELEPIVYAPNMSKNLEAHVGEEKLRVPKLD